MTPHQAVKRIKADEYYRYFKNYALPQKLKNEEKASLILLNSKGNICKKELEVVIELVNAPYTADSGHVGANGPWFGQMKSNATRALKENNESQVHKWLTFLLSGNATVQSKINTLAETSNPLHLDYASVGMITLMLYLTDKNKYSIWFESQHVALEKLYPSIGRFNKSGNKYEEFNSTLKRFAKEFDFCDTELDFVLYLIGK